MVKKAATATGRARKAKASKASKATGKAAKRSSPVGRTAKKSKAPWGTRVDGTPRSKPGRKAV